jgi:hypothetical protein
MRTKIVGRHWLGALLSLSLMLSPALVTAQSDAQRASARAAAQAGLDAFDAQKWSEALELFSRAEGSVHAPVHLYYIGYSRMKLGKLVDAREAFLKLVHESIPANAPKAFREAQTDAKKELAALEPRIPTLKILVTPEAKGTVLKIDDQEGAVAGVPTPIDPGKHVLQARAEGMESEPITMAVNEGARAEVTLTMKASAKAAAVVAPASAAPSASASPSAAAPAPAAVESPSPPPGEASDGVARRRLRVPAYASFGVAGVGLIVGTVFALQSASKQNEAEGLCPGGRCPSNKRDEVTDLNSDADSKGKLAVVGFTVGGVAAAAGVTLFLLPRGGSGDAPAQTSKPTVAPVLGWRTAGIAGVF